MIFLMALLLSSPTLFAAEKIHADHVEVSLLAPQSFAGKSEPIAVHFKPQKDWHIYWKNPGDSGAAPKFSFTSTSATFGEVQWPFPERIPVGPMVNFGYVGDVVYPILLTPKSDTAVSGKIKLEWLVCKEECVPGFGEFSFTRPVIGVDAVWEARDRTLLKSFLDRIPADAKNAPYEIVSAERIGSALEVTVQDRSGNSNSAPEIFPLDGDFLLPSVPAVTTSGEGLYVFTLQLQPAAATAEAKSVVSTGFVLANEDSAWQWDAVPVSMGTSSTTESSELWFLIGSAFLGGLLLNLMPCVFPVLSIKVFSLMNSTASSRARIREGLFYTLGVLCTFATLGIVFLMLRQAGQNIGWGFQLQSPIIVYALAVLFWLMGLNFLGVFEFGGRVMNVAGRQSSHSSSFATGILSVFIAAPCTGPFMGSALGASATLPPIEAMSIFLGLGVGLAFPFLVLAASPGLARKLPRPGAWMEKLKQLFAFPLFATVLWLLWVLQIQAGSNGWLAAAAGLFAVSFFLWIGKTWVKLKLAATVIAILVLIFTAQQIRNANGNVAAGNAAASAWQPFDQTQITSARASKKAVFVDFTAAWCITCQVNKKVVLETAAAQKLFSENNVLLIRADWTSQDPKITTALAEFGRNSVPLYVYYDADGSPAKTLPQILTIDDIESLFNNPKKENDQ